MGRRITIRCDKEQELEKRIKDSELRGSKLIDKGIFTDTVNLRKVYWARMELTAK